MGKHRFLYLFLSHVTYPKQRIDYVDSVNTDVDKKAKRDGDDNKVCLMRYNYIATYFTMRKHENINWK